MNNTIAAQVGIYENVKYRCIGHRDGSVTVVAPCVRWIGNTGALAYRRVRLTGQDAIDALRCFTSGRIWPGNGHRALTELI
jgi:hypothetical protein